MSYRSKFLRTTKALLVAAGLCVGASAWADAIHLTTMTGVVGLEDNSAAWWTYYSKTATIKKGESYTYTFTNYDLQTLNDETGSWILEIRDQSTSYCFDARGNSDTGSDNAGWKWDNSTETLTYNYTGKVWSNLYSSASDFKTAYNGVEVTLTITRSADGGTVTVTRAATLSGSKDFSGTWTCSGFTGSDNMTIDLIALYAHQNITNVVYTDASGVVTHYDLKNVDLSASNFTTDTGSSASYSDGVATVTTATYKSGNSNRYSWAKLPLSSYFSEVDGTLTNVYMSFTENVGTGGRIAIGIYDKDKNSWPNTQGYQDLNNAVSAWGIMSSSGTRLYYNDGTENKNLSVVTTGSDAAIVVDMDMINKKFTWIQAGTTRVNNQYFCDNTVSEPGYLGWYNWSTENVTTISNLTMQLTWIEATYYTATFTNTTSGNSVSATIYSNSEKTSPVSNGMLENGGTYYFTASEEGYQDYEGSFTVSSVDPAVSFAMTAKAVYNYSVNAVDAESGIIKSNIVSGTCYADESTSFYLPTCVLVDGTLHFMAAESSYKNETVTSNNQVFSYTYTTNTVDNVVYFVEGESISGASTSTPTGNQNLASNGYMGRGSNLNVTTLPAGSYTVYVKYINTNSGAHSLVVKAGDVDVINATDVTVRPTKNGSVTLTESTDITLTASGSSTSGVDYLYIVKTGEAGTIASSGFSSLASAYGLDFSNATGLTAAYVVTNTTNDAVTLTSVSELPANSGVILKGTGGATYSIPVKADAAYAGTNLLSAAVTAIVVDNDAAYILKDGKFCLISGAADEAARTIPAGKAYLLASNVPSAARSLGFMFGDESTGINAVSRDLQNGEFYNLQGQRVDAPLKGLYIVNGKKVLVK